MIGADPGEPREPGEVELQVECPGVDLKWAIDERDLEEAQYIDDWEPKNDQTELAVKLLIEYSIGSIDIFTARELLVDE